MSVQVSLRKILMGILVSAALSVPAMAEVKIGVVDYARLLEQSPQAKALQDSLKNEFGPRYQQLVAQGGQLKSRAAKLQKDGAHHAHGRPPAGRAAGPAVARAQARRGARVRNLRAGEAAREALTATPLRSTR